MRSFVIEYIKRNNEEDTLDNEVELELHVNLWNFKKLETTFDFGFMVDNIDNIENIILYVPFKVKKVEDLGNNIIEKNQILVDAIFNERCETIKFYPKRLKVIKKGNYDTRDRRSADIDNTKDYFRIRFFPDSNEITMIKRENEKINIFQDASLRTTEIIDFRINDLRSCPENLREEFLRTPRFTIKKIHYLIMRSSTDEYITIGDTEVKGRLLEKEIWKNYIDIEENDMIAYHIIKKGDGTFLNLSRFKYPLNVGERLFWYIFIAIIFSLVSSYIYDKISELFF